MAFEFYYVCSSCSHTWSLCSNPMVVGPTTWGAKRLDCLGCKASLEVPVEIEPRLWRKWRSDHADACATNAHIHGVMSIIDQIVDGAAPYAKLPVSLPDVTCPVCAEPMIDDWVRNQLMKCPKCAAVTGRFDGTSFGPVRCVRCNRLSFAHRYDGIDIECPHCQGGTCSDIDPDSLVQSDGT